MFLSCNHTNQSITSPTDSIDLNCISMHCILNILKRFYQHTNTYILMMTTLKNKLVRNAVLNLRLMLSICLTWTVSDMNIFWGVHVYLIDICTHCIMYQSLHDWCVCALWKSWRHFMIWLQHVISLILHATKKVKQVMHIIEAHHDSSTVIVIK